MKFQIEKETLLNPLQKIIGAVEKRQTMPALSNVLIRTTENSLTLTAIYSDIKDKYFVVQQLEWTLGIFNDCGIVDSKTSKHLMHFLIRNKDIVSVIWI